MAELPEFETAARLGGDAVSLDEWAECHGLASGLLSGKPQLAFTDYQQSLLAMELIPAPSRSMLDLLQDLLDSTRSQLRDEQLGFDLWLPTDSESLGIRTRSLGSWCSGYLTGLSESCGRSLDQLSEDVIEAVRDLTQVSRVALEDGEETEAEENAFFEVVEFVRIAVMLVKHELDRPRPPQSLH